MIFDSEDDADIVGWKHKREESSPFTQINQERSKWWAWLDHKQ